jgi:formate hydrogenlyase subunit 3/multisubunit Na+/H+ antiporter MnhD subunit
MLGGLALAGFPLTAGFPIHWAVYRAIWSWAQPFAAPASDGAVAQTWVWVLVAIALLASSAGIVVGVLRGLGAMLGGEAPARTGRQPVLASLMVLILAALVILLGIYPQLFLGPVRMAAQALTSF